MKGHRKNGTRPRLIGSMLMLLGLLALVSSPALAQRLTVKNHLPFSATRNGESLNYLKNSARGGDGNV
ncbi:MAG TPA: hypothetical protein VGB05_10105, partial [Pyrinomonadaceae bacterium]